MLHIIRYTCSHEALPRLEAALVAHGFTVDVPRQRSVGGGDTVVLVQGSASILLAQDLLQERAEVELWGVAADAVVPLLEVPELRLHRLPMLMIAS